MVRKKPTVWVVMHYEYMGPTDAPYIDSVQFHVSSSLRRAERYIREDRVSAHSWWQVHPHVVDTRDYDEGTEVYYYSHRGTPLRSPPFKRARAAFDKERGKGSFSSIEP